MRAFASRKFLAVALVLLISTLTVNGASSKETTVVKDVSFNADGQSMEVRITATSHTKYTYFELNSPRRLVIDFHGIQSEVGFKEKLINNLGVERVRASLFSDRRRQATRIVFDLMAGVPYRVLDDPDGVVRIVFGETVSAPLNQTAGLPETVKFAEPLSFPKVDLGSPMFRSDWVPVAPEPPQPALSPATEPLMTLASAMQASAVMPLAMAARPLQLAQTNITVAPPMTPQAPLANPVPTEQYSGEIISLDLRDFDVKDFFRLIGEISGLNIVLDPNVAGTITLKLTDVPWDQALDIVLRNYQFGGQLQGNVLRIATNSTLQSEEQARKALRDAQEQAAELQTRTFVLNYVKSDSAAATLQGLLSPRGAIIQDARRNALIISDTPSQFSKVDEMVRFLDTPAQQVEIEARLLSANKSFSRDIGNQLGFVLGNRGGNILTGAPRNASPFDRTPPPRAVSGGNGIPLLSNFPAAATSGLSFLLQSGGDVILDEIITAAEARGTAKLISRPKVTTQNNQAAVVSQGTQIPVQTNVNNTVSVQFLNFSLQLQVTPQITEAGTILLTVSIENSQPDFARAVNGIPSVSTQRAQTQVLIPDGGTAAIGGILVDSDSVNIRQVPGLGSLPVIGHLFKNTSTIKSTSELLFFITPRIKPQDSISAVMPIQEAAPAEPQAR